MSLANSEVLATAQSDILDFARDRLQRAWIDMNTRERRSAFEAMTQAVDDMSAELKMMKSEVM